MTTTVVATPEPGNIPPRVRLDVTDVGGAHSSVTVNRLDPDGRVSPVRTADGGPLVLTVSGSDQVGLLYDYEMPYSVAVQYTTVEDPASSSAAVTVSVIVPWLIHPGVPEISMPVTVTDMTALSRGVQQGVFWPMGRGTPVVVTDGARKSAAYTLSLYTDTDSDRLGLVALMSDASSLLFNPPAGWGMDAQYIAVGDFSEQRVNSNPGEPTRIWQLSCTVVARPAGGSQAERTYVDVLTDNATYADLLVKYPSYLALLAGP